MGTVKLSRLQVFSGADNGIRMPDTFLLEAFFVTFSIAVFVCWTILLTKKFHLNFTAKGHSSAARQSSHRVPTPRIGGLGILAIAAGALLTDGEASFLAILLLLSALPVFIGGFGEDIGFDVTPKMRLLLSFVSAAIAGVVLDAWVARSGIPYLDTALAFPLFSIAFTILMSGGICHAINLVDGLNGLALGLSIIMACSLAAISAQVGDTSLVLVCLLLAGSQLGVFFFNFPFGKIFLGDAGAYSIGHLLTWISILLLVRNPEVGPFAVFLIFFWPVADMLFSISRRLRTGKPIDQPDRMHFHQFVMRAIELTLNTRRSVSNPLASVAIWPLASIPIALAVRFYDSNMLSAALWAACFCSFVWTYVAGIRLAKFLSRSRRTNETLAATINREGISNIRSALFKQRI